MNCLKCFPCGSRPLMICCKSRLYFPSQISWNRCFRGNPAELDRAANLWQNGCCSWMSRLYPHSIRTISWLLEFRQFFLSQETLYQCLRPSETPSQVPLVCSKGTRLLMLLSWPARIQRSLERGLICMCLWAIASSRWRGCLALTFGELRPALYRVLWPWWIWISHITKICPCIAGKLPRLYR